MYFATLKLSFYDHRASVSIFSGVYFTKGQPVNDLLVPNLISDLGEKTIGRRGGSTSPRSTKVKL